MLLGCTIRDGLLALGGDFIEYDITVLHDFALDGCNGVVDRCRAYISFSTHHWSAGGDFWCDLCRNKFLGILPPHRAFIDRALRLAECDNIVEGPCLLCNYDRWDTRIKGEGYCKKCRGGHKKEGAMMARCYLLVGQMGLPSELVREIMGFVVRV
jgi:hypothetical protein